MVTTGATSTSVQPQPGTSSATKDKDRVENLRPKLLEGEYDLQSEPVPSALKSKHSFEPAAKRVRVDGEEIARVTTVAINGLDQEMQGVKARMAEKESNNKKIEKAIIDSTCVLCKLVDYINKLRSSIEESSKREDRRLEKERRWDEELRREREE